MTCVLAKKSSSSKDICKFILNVIQNVGHSKDVIMNITVDSSAYTLFTRVTGLGAHLNLDSQREGGVPSREALIK